MDDELLPTAQSYEENADALCRLALNSRDDSAKRELMVLALESLRPLDKRSTIFWDEE